MAGNLDTLRKEIEEIDAEIAQLIGRRLKAAEKVAEAKMDMNLPIVNPEVEKRVEQRYRDNASRLGISEDSMARIARILIDEAVERERRICGKE